MSYKYNGKLIRLGDRLERLPNEEDLSQLIEGFRPFATLGARMPKKNDLIKIASRGDVLWRVEDCATSKKLGWKRFACPLYHYSGYEHDQYHTDYLGLTIALEESALEDPYTECVNKMQAMYTDIEIVGQVQPVRTYARLPSLPVEAVEALGLE